MTDNYIPVGIDPRDAEILIGGINETCQGLSKSVFGWTLEHILHEKPYLTEEQNALNFLEKHYNTLGGIIRLIAASTNTLYVAFANDDLQITEGNRFKLQTENKTA